MTPAEFYKKMKELSKYWEGNEESHHQEADELMCEILKELGYGEGIEIFKDMEKWYA